MLETLYPQAHARYLSLPVLGGVLEDLCQWLASKGHPPDAIRRRVAAARILEESLRRHGIDSLRECTAQDLRSCKPEPTTWTPTNARTLARSLEQYLEDRGELATAPPSPTRQIVLAYRAYLEEVRGLAPASLARCETRACQFLEFIGYDADQESLGKLDATHIAAFMTDLGHQLGRVTMQKVAVRLRAFLKFLISRGEIRAGLDRQVDSPRLYRGRRLPRSLPWDDTVKLLQRVDRSNAKGLRDYAMLLLIATYGLRRGEVVALSLDDISWRKRQIDIQRPKLGFPLTFPLTDEVATALHDYLRHGRPPSSRREVFLRARVPLGDPIEPTAVYNAFAHWAKKADIHVPSPGGPHCLRHYVEFRTISPSSGILAMPSCCHIVARAQVDIVLTSFTHPFCREKGVDREVRYQLPGDSVASAGGAL